MTAYLKYRANSSSSWTDVSSKTGQAVSIYEGTLAGGAAYGSGSLSAALEPRGAGDYQVTWTSQGRCNGGTAIDITPQNPPPSGIVSVTRPTITVPFGSYGQNQWAFWYLNGAPNIDEYTVSATLTGNPNYTGTIITKSWFGVDKATKVSFNPTNASSTTITSNAASDSTTYDVSVKFSIDGLNSDKLWIHINTPVSLYTNSISDQGHPSGCSGYLTRFEYIGVDLWNYALTKITTNETFDADIPGPNPPTAGWPANAPDAWTPDKWATNSTFVDSLYAYDCQGTWQPQPVTPRGLNSLVKSVPQKLYMGSATNGNGKLVKSATQDFYTDHANVR